MQMKLEGNRASIIIDDKEKIYRIVCLECNEDLRLDDNGDYVHARTWKKECDDCSNEPNW